MKPEDFEGLATAYTRNNADAAHPVRRPSGFAFGKVALRSCFALVAPVPLKTAAT